MDPDGQRDRADHQGFSDTESQNIAFAIPVDDLFQEKDAHHYDNHTQQPGLEIIQIAHTQPAGRTAGLLDE